MERKGCCGERSLQMEVFWQIVLYDSEGAQITAADGWQRGPQTLLIAQQAPAELLLCVSYSLGSRMCKHMHLRFRSLTYSLTHSPTHPLTYQQRSVYQEGCTHANLRHTQNINQKEEKKTAWLRGGDR